MDTIILGCTHYPHLKKTISDIVGSGVTLIDSGGAAACEAKRRMTEEGLLTERTEPGEVRYYVSDTIHGFEELGSLFLSKKIVGEVSKVDIEKY